MGFFGGSDGQNVPPISIEECRERANYVGGVTGATVGGAVYLIAKQLTALRGPPLALITLTVAGLSGMGFWHISYEQEESAMNLFKRRMQTVGPDGKVRYSQDDFTETGGIKYR